MIFTTQSTFFKVEYCTMQGDGEILSL